MRDCSRVFPITIVMFGHFYQIKVVIWISFGLLRTLPFCFLPAESGKVSWFAGLNWTCREAGARRVKSLSRGAVLAGKGWVTSACLCSGVHLQLWTQPVPLHRTVVIQEEKPKHFHCIDTAEGELDVRFGVKGQGSQSMLW